MVLIVREIDSWGTVAEPRVTVRLSKAVSVLRSEIVVPRASRVVELERSEVRPGMLRTDVRDGVRDDARAESVRLSRAVATTLRVPLDVRDERRAVTESRVPELRARRDELPARDMVGTPLRVVREGVRLERVMRETSRAELPPLRLERDVRAMPLEPARLVPVSREERTREDDEEPLLPRAREAPRLLLARDEPRLLRALEAPRLLLARDEPRLLRALEAPRLLLARDEPRLLAREEPRLLARDEPRLLRARDTPRLLPLERAAPRELPDPAERAEFPLERELRWASTCCSSGVANASKTNAPKIARNSLVGVFIEILRPDSTASGNAKRGRRHTCRSGAPSRVSTLTFEAACSK